MLTNKRCCLEVVQSLSLLGHAQRVCGKAYAAGYITYTCKLSATKQHITFNRLSLQGGIALQCSTIMR